MHKLEYIWLSKIQISNLYKFKLIKMFGGIENLFKSSLDDLVFFGLKDNIIFKILDKKIKEEALYELEYVNKNKIDIISYEEKHYPKNFKLIKDKPVSFYIKGDRSILNNKSIGIVGSRVALRESLEASRFIARKFSDNGFNIISGLAKGIDKYAHLGALDSIRKW